MRTAYRVLALLVVAGVVVQAGSIAMGFFGVFHEVDDGGAITSSFDWESNLGVMVHRFNGFGTLLWSLALLVVSFFVRTPGATRRALAVLGLLVLQIALLFPAFGVAASWGALHGVNALVLLGAALHAARRVDRVRDEPARELAAA